MDGAHDSIAELRRRAGVTQAEMAVGMQVPLRTYEDIEAGRATFRPIHQTAALMALLRIAVAEENAAILTPDLRTLVLKAAKLIGNAERGTS